MRDRMAGACRAVAWACCALTLPCGMASAAEPPSGRWRVTAAERLAGEGMEPLAADDGIYLGKSVEFKPQAVAGPGPFNCGNAGYDYASMPATAFFQGYGKDAADAKRIARATGLPDPAPTLMVICDTGIYDFHMVDDETMKIMMDLVIYTLRQQP